MHPAIAVLSTVANPKAGPKNRGESGEDANPRKTIDSTYVDRMSLSPVPSPGDRSWLWP